LLLREIAEGRRAIEKKPGKMRQDERKEHIHIVTKARLGGKGIGK
jgi:hypothetical protein